MFTSLFCMKERRTKMSICIKNLSFLPSFPPTFRSLYFLSVFFEIITDTNRINTNRRIRRQVEIGLLPRLIATHESMVRFGRKFALIRVIGKTFLPWKTDIT